VTKIEALEYAVVLWENIDKYGFEEVSSRLVSLLHFQKEYGGNARHRAVYRVVDISQLIEEKKLPSGAADWLYDCPLCELYFENDCQDCPWPHYPGSDSSTVRCEDGHSPYLFWSEYDGPASDVLSLMRQLLKEERAKEKEVEK